MEMIEQLAQAALERDNFRLRSLVQDIWHANIQFNTIPLPATLDPLLLAITAALVELLAARQGQLPPAWTQDVFAPAEPFFMVKSAESMKNLRALCETQSPEPMRKRLLYAPPNFLQFA